MIGSIFVSFNALAELGPKTSNNIAIFKQFYVLNYYDVIVLFQSTI